MKKLLALFSLFLATPVLAQNAPSAPPALRTVPQSPAQIQLSFAPVVARVAPAVVNVYSSRVVRQSANPFFGDPFLNQFFGRGLQRNRVEQSLGSGVIVRADGIILTNNHVVQGGTDIKVALTDRREFSARILLADSRTDLAVLKIDTKGERLPALAFGDSDRLQVGDLVLAIGDPFGVGQTVTSGIVSALARTDVGASDYQFFIQTDAAINPGNSGGALVTMDGRLAGINNSIVSSSGGNIGIGFAIPSNMARLVVDGALGGGIKRPWLGADGQAVTADIARGLGLPKPQGVLISRVFPGGPASAAGIAKGDVVMALDGFPVFDSQGLRYRVATRKAGDVMKVDLYSQNSNRSVTVKVGLPPDAGRSETVLQGNHPMVGVRVANITPALADEMGLDFSLKGVTVISVENSVAARRFGIQAGDMVRSVNGQEIQSIADLNRALGASRGWDIAIQRGALMLRLSVN